MLRQTLCKQLCKSDLGRKNKLNSKCDMSYRETRCITHVQGPVVLTCPTTLVQAENEHHA